MRDTQLENEWFNKRFGGYHENFELKSKSVAKDPDGDVRREYSARRRLRT